MQKEILPINILPCEKLELYGESALTSLELIAIILKTGIKDKSAMEISKELFEIAGNTSSLRFLQEISIQDLIKIKGIGKSKAIELKAIGEIAKRMNEPILKKHKIISNKDVYKLFETELKFEKNEYVKILILNTKNIILKICTISVGGANYAMLEPKQVLAEAVKLEAQKIILVHNHPSGDATPSLLDYKITQRVDKAAQLLGITLLDHIIIGDGNYRSIKK